MDELGFIRFREDCRLAMSAEVDELARLALALERLEVHVGLRERPRRHATPEERERRRRAVARLAAEGKTRQAIADELGVGVASVKDDLRRFRQANGDRAEA